MGKYYDDGNRETRGIDLTPDGKRVAMIFRASSNEVGGRVIEIETGKELCPLAPQPLPRFGGVARFSSDGKRVAQVANGVARIWNAETGADAVPRLAIAAVWARSCRRRMERRFSRRVPSHGSGLGTEYWQGTVADDVFAVRRRALRPEGIVVQESLFGMNGPGSLLDAKTGKCRPLPGELASAVSKPMIAEMGRPAADALLAMSPDGMSMVTLALHDSAFRIWSWPTGKLKSTVPIAPPEKLKLGHCLAGYLTPDGKQFVAVMDYNRTDNFLEGGKRSDPVFIERWDLANGKMLSRVDGGTTHSPPKLIPYANGVMVLGSGPEVRDAVTGTTLVKLTIPEGQADDFHWAIACRTRPTNVCCPRKWLEQCCLAV